MIICGALNCFGVGWRQTRRRWVLGRGLDRGLGGCPHHVTSCGRDVSAPFYFQLRAFVCTKLWYPIPRNQALNTRSADGQTPLGWLLKHGAAGLLAGDTLVGAATRLLDRGASAVVPCFKEQVGQQATTTTTTPDHHYHYHHHRRLPPVESTTPPVL